MEKLMKSMEKKNRALKEILETVPIEFVDPITQDIMCDPVVTADGHSYERKAILLWFKSSSRSPMTNLVLKDKTVYPNYNLKSQIESYKERVIEKGYKGKREKKTDEM